jgi:OOP family OmpA-OmpF porin
VEYNQILSEKRAASVLRYLLEKGIPVSRLISVSYGETRPIRSNRTSEGRRNNRRVQFNLY